MRYVIIGAGAVGGTIGGRLFESGRETVLVARGAHYRALRDGGLRLTTPQEGTRTLSVPAVDGPQALPLRPDDVLVLAVKSQDTAAVLAEWGARPVEGGGLAADLLPVVCAQNAVENERVALRLFRRVYGMCVWLPATHLDPGEVVAHCAPLSGILTVGRYPGGVDRTIEQIAEDLSASCFHAPAVPDVMRWKYGKLLSNLANAVEAVVGREGSGQRDVQELCRRARAEGEAVLTAAGIAFSDPAERAEVLGDRMRVQPIAGAERRGGSTWQSLARGARTTESDYLNGEIALLGRQSGLGTPVNDLLQRLAVGFAREGRAPGSMTAHELLALMPPE
ncbi:ketopantoate reductase family protein [Streptacidiphilus sp. PB12-B1b]|uniref:ketopantoate reductase family protein n=1 Tax=Streptacidiphilus sp. PB12-B1b TaxID=2705012 RepID=UPI0015F92140|nr:ketopantoate reductase family protein [Streptacidiphilus sp. PB12-B1b]QMU77534.1 ketopantoate reductase family protein [Streptacidiphilus sp. PB12-B1b]